MNTSNRLLFVSPSFCNTFDGKEEDLLGKNLLELVHKDDRDRIQKTLDATHVPPYTCYHEERTLTKSGLRWFAWSAKGILSDDGTVTEVISVGRDVTSRKKAEEERELLIKNLEQKNAEMERFLYTVSHDLKSPLVTIEGFLNIVKKDLKKNDTSKLQSFISRMLNASVKMRELLDDLLNLSRIGRVVNEYEDVSFRDIVNDAMELLSVSIEKKNIKITVEDNLPTVRGDRQRLTEVVMNLLENAIKFTSSEKNPVITVGTKKGEDGVIYFVKDNGIGIDPIYFEKIFGLFNKLDPNSEGTGVGLALIKRIIECHNGKIWVESNGQGKGCTFCFTIKA
ncbi:MAG: PAS domain S-box protein [Candidatus Auribacter fodinae]|jgi:PAS domain S-box-containing protein|uniref:histidine kinase n=1 Tax=Candidatus Auribacter fodinae TaxID=2093366 RepID=A0A3A4R2Y3_9BACT|nr:MAG: PAS domain S-box protein [Candidatus Auribacter fodinae]